MTVKAAVVRLIARLDSLSRAQRPGPRVLLYHSVTADERYDAMEMTVSAARFRRQLATLREEGYAVRSAEWLVDTIRSGGRIEERTAVVTFDDGLTGVHERAAPALAEQAFPSTVFLLAAALRGESERILPRWPDGYLDRARVRELAAGSLMTFGCHGDAHRAFSGRSEAGIRAELLRAKAEVEDVVGREAALLAYPFGVREMWRATPRRAARAAGFRGAFTSVFGTSGAGSDPYRLRRTRVSWRDTPGRFRDLLAGRYDWYAAAQGVRAAVDDVMSAVRRR